MKTDKDMREAIIYILDEGTPDGHTAYDVRGIVAACHREAGSWDLDLVGTERFWQIVQAIDAANRSRPREAAPTGQELLNAMIAKLAESAPWAWQGSPDARVETNARISTVLHAVTIMYPSWGEDRAEEWLIERIDELRLAAIQD